MFTKIIVISIDVTRIINHHSVELLKRKISLVIQCIKGTKMVGEMARGTPRNSSNRNVIVTEVTVENFRCFSSAQTVPLAPLTFLVGENSTGKTSLLAITRVLWDMAFRSRTPIFNEPPFDVGGFDEIVFKDSTNKRSKTIQAGIGVSDEFVDNRVANESGSQDGSQETVWRYRSSFKKQGDVPALSAITVSQGEYKIEERFDDDYVDELHLKSTECEQVLTFGKENEDLVRFPVNEVLYTPDFYLYILGKLRDKQREHDANSARQPMVDEDLLVNMREFIAPSPFSSFIRMTPQFAAYATSPVRSKPSRTYHATNFPTDPEGNFVPYYLANVHSRASKDWKSIQLQLESFGEEMGLFDKLSIEKTTELDGSPFQIHVRMPGVNDSRDSNRSLVDVGYGVSQALPIMVSLLDKKSAPLTLLQQPEIHLHPKAQAAMADVLCKFVQSAERQLMVETHSDYIIERARIRIKEEKLHPSMVVVLFFERTKKGVQIHPIRFDHLGNVVDAPPSYRKFFLDEMDRSMGLD